MISSLMMVAMATEASFDVVKNIGKNFQLKENIGNLAKKL